MPGGGLVQTRSEPVAIATRIDMNRELLAGRQDREWLWSFFLIVTRRMRTATGIGALVVDSIATGIGPGVNEDNSVRSPDMSLRRDSEVMKKRGEAVGCLTRPKTSEAESQALQEKKSQASPMMQ